MDQTSSRPAGLGSMMTCLWLLGGGVVLAAVTLEAQTAAAKPGPEHKKLDIWVGDWTYELEAQTTPLGPGGKYTGKATVRSILGGVLRGIPRPRDRTHRDHPMV